ncbi:MAG: hypothetical protein AAGA69_04325 [Pseudomonadota bacterium]
MTFKAILLAISGLLATSPAMAQSNALGSPGKQVIEGISMAQMAGHLQSRGMSVEYGTRQDGRTFLGVTTASGGKFILDFRVCENEAQFLGCKLVESIILFQSNNTSLARINSFHEQNSAVSTAIYYGELIALTQKMVLEGGVTIDNIDFRLGLYFNDAESFQRAVLTPRSVEVNFRDADFPPLDAAASQGGAPRFSFPSTGDHVNAANVTFSSGEPDTDGFVN